MVEWTRSIWITEWIHEGTEWMSKYLIDRICLMNEWMIGRLLPGSLLCGWLRAPSVLMCGDQDWDVIGQGTANRICGAGLTYNEQQRSFVFDFGGQKFTISERRFDENMLSHGRSDICFLLMISCFFIQLIRRCRLTARTRRTTRLPSSASRQSSWTRVPGNCLSSVVSRFELGRQTVTDQGFSLQVTAAGSGEQVDEGVRWLGQVGTSEGLWWTGGEQ